MSVIGGMDEVAKVVTLLDRHAATAEEEAILKELEAHGWTVREWRDVIARPARRDDG